jgi:hypothetical protein
VKGQAMTKYRVIKEYRPILGKIMYAVEKKGWFFYWHVGFKHSKKQADDLIKELQSEGL